MADHLALMFDRPCEPLFIPKGEKKVSFDIPPNYLNKQYQPMAQKILSRFGESATSTVPIRQIAIPDLTIPLKLSRDESFSPFIPSHQEMANQLTKLFMGMRTVEDLVSLAAYCHDRINSEMFIYSLSVAILNRPDTQNVKIPQLSEVMPHKFMDAKILSRAREESEVVESGSRNPIEIPMNYTAANTEPEQLTAYFREDVGVNLHHWHWHLVNPFSAPPGISERDRRGELFYYMHHQIMARFNTERLCNGLDRVRPLLNLREPIAQAYFPKMDTMVAGRPWPARPMNMVLSDVNREADGLVLTIANIEQSRDRVMEAIRTRQARTTSGTTIRLDETTGIDILGDMVEASGKSPNIGYYGSLHNSGHNLIAFAHDPEHRFLESFGVMANSTTAMRDPIFYRWHGFIDLIFKTFKDSLPAYTQQQLNFPGVTVTSIGVTTARSNPNTLNCHWNKSDIELSRGLDFAPRGSIVARLTHLNHEEFTYTIIVNNANNTEKMGTVRIFLAPRFDENRRPLSVDDQRMLMIEMDKFTTRLRRGQNTITRRSTESAVTIPFEATFRDLDADRPNDLQGADQFNFCGCGWPQHMLVPKGTTQGYSMDLFVMVSDYEVDRVNQSTPTGCRDGVSYCGLKDRRYPDSRAMGYPFDRVVRQGVRDMNGFLTSNMRISQLTVRFNDTVVARQSSQTQARTG